MKRVKQLFIIIFAVAMILCGGFVAMIGLDYFMIIDGYNQWPVLITEIPNENKIYVAIMLVVVGLVCATSIPLFSYHRKK